LNALGGVIETFLPTFGTAGAKGVTSGAWSANETPGERSATPPMERVEQQVARAMVAAVSSGGLEWFNVSPATVGYRIRGSAMVNIR